ncbi:MAG: pilin [Elusimicrobiaceae bacterium]|nr:pilin [Elusimicrobiaceae bacterium]
MQNKKGFTLIELLVVVLIIGILAAIALPQYRKVVEKSKVSEVLVNIAAIEGTIQRYILTNGYPSEKKYFEDFADIELSGGEWTDNGHSYYTKNFHYWIACNKNNCVVEAYRQRPNTYYDIYALVSIITNEGITHSCFTEQMEIGRYICQDVESQGWDYYDQDF